MACPPVFYSTQVCSSPPPPPPELRETLGNEETPLFSRVVESFYIYWIGKKIKSLDLLPYKTLLLN